MGQSLRYSQSRGDFLRMTILSRNISQEQNNLQTCSMSCYLIYLKASISLIATLFHKDSVKCVYTIMYHKMK